MLRGYVLPSRRAAASSQIEALEAAGVTVIYQEGKGIQSFEYALRSLRKGDALAVKNLADLANDRRELQRRMKLIHERGAYVKEVATGRDSRSDAADMVFDAADILAQTRKGHDPAKARLYGARGGRPGHQWTEPQREMIERHWYDMRHKTNDEAIDAINARLTEQRSKNTVTVHYVWRMMKDKTGNGASGRITGPRGKSVMKRKTK